MSEQSQQPRSLERFEQIPLAALRESGRNPRRSFNEQKLEELTQSVRDIGIITPIIVRPSTVEEGVYEIAAGHRRYRAAQAAELETVPAMVREYSDDEFIEVLTVENLQRADIAPLEEAQGYHELLARPGYDVAVLAAKIGKSETYVYQRLKLLDLVDAAKTALVEERIHVSHALVLARVQPEAQARLLHQHVFDRDGHVMSAKSLQSVIERTVYLDLAKTAFPIHDAGLLPKAGACDTCAKRSGAAPALFPEVKAKDFCLDRACFYQKSNEWTSRQVKRVAAENGEKPLTVSAFNEWNTDLKAKKDVLFCDKWRPVKRGTGCPSTKKAVVVEAGVHRDREFRQGDVVEVCTNSKCVEHFGGSLYSPQRVQRTASELKAELNRAHVEAIEVAQHEALITAAVAAAPSKIFPELLRELARVMWARLWHDHRVKVLARRGIKRQTSRDSDRDDQLRDDIRNMADVELIGLITEIAIREDSGSLKASEQKVLDVALDFVDDEERLRVITEAKEAVDATFAAKRARIDKAEEKRKAEEKAAKAAAATTKTAVAGNPATGKGKRK